MVFARDNGKSLGLQNVDVFLVNIKDNNLVSALADLSLVTPHKASAE